MIILLLVLIWTQSEHSSNSEYLAELEKPDVDIVRQIGYVQRMLDKEYSSKPGVKRMNVGGNMSDERVNALRAFIAGKTKGTCDFTCHECYRCSLDDGVRVEDNKEDMVFYE